jgi:hypothetical protein
MHSIKLPFANYVLKNTKKNFRGIGLRASSTHDLVALVTRNVTLFNLAMYTEMMPEEEKELVLSSKIKSFKNQHGNGEEIRTLGRIAARKIHQAWQTLGADFMRDFHYDIHAESKCWNLSKISFNAIWMSYTRTAGIFHQGIEKTKPVYERLIRDHSKGGFSWSCQDRVNAGEKMSIDSEQEAATAKTILEYDINSSYPAAVKNMMVPKGFAVGYKKATDDDGKLLRCDPVCRQKSFEFKAVFYVLSKNANLGISIRSVYSNYSQLGFFKIGNYPLDLAIVFDNGRVALYNFDGQFVHGCPVCPALRNYVGQQSRETVEEETRKRDEFINNFVAAAAADMTSYTVLTDCHGDLENLNHLFQQDERLVEEELVKGYPVCQELQNFPRANLDKDLTYIALVSGEVTANEKTKPIILLNAETKKWERCNSARNLLVTRDTLEWLMKEHSFVTTDVTCVIFYKTCKVLPKIYEKLVRIRASPHTTDCRKKLLKKVGNFSCGYFGSNPGKRLTTSTFRLVHQLPVIYDILTSQILPVGNFCEREFYFVKRNKLNKPRKCTSALPLFFSVVEYGKTRISQILCFLEKYLDASKFRHLYTNVDNLVLCLAENSIDECVPAEKMDEYLREKENFFQPSEPGHLKLEWIEESTDWKFCTGMTQNYAILAGPRNSRHKNSALSCVTSQQSYDMSCSLLDRQRVKVTQIRRENKLLGLAKKTTTFTFG